jgi:hypothetical protein
MNRLSLTSLLLLVAGTAQADPPLAPVFDAHVHYNLDIGRPVSVERVFELWREAGIRGVLLTSRPNDGTRELLEKAPAEFKTVAFVRPYVTMADVQTWFRDPAIYAMVERELTRGIYTGIGEFHIFGRDADDEGFARFVRLAAQRKFWLHAHCDDYVIERIFALDPQARVIWAHTGMSTPESRIDELFARYPNLHGELSFRGGITVGGELSLEWRGLFDKYPDRFLLGSDTWINQRWIDYGSTMKGYRDWLAQLPAEQALRIAHGNAERIYGGKMPD